MRLSDSEWTKFKEAGGAEWLRKVLGTKPRRYYEVFKQPKEHNGANTGIKSQEGRAGDA
jgi:hypothetical protein